MLRVFFILLMLLVGLLGYVWYNIQSTPGSWQATQTYQPDAVFSADSNVSGKRFILESYLSSTQSGGLTFSENELNNLLQLHLLGSEDGRNFLGYSEEIEIRLIGDKVQFGCFIDLEKFTHTYPAKEKYVRYINKLLPFLDNHRIFITLTTKPATRDGGIILAHDVHMQIGELSVPPFLLHLLDDNTVKLRSRIFRMEYINLGEIMVSNKKLFVTLRLIF